MSQAENKQAKESKLWLVGMISLVIAIAIFVVAAILIQHQELTTETVTTTNVQNS